MSCRDATRAHEVTFQGLRCKSHLVHKRSHYDDVWSKPGDVDLDLGRDDVMSRYEACTPRSERRPWCQIEVHAQDE